MMTHCRYFAFGKRWIERRPVYAIQEGLDASSVSSYFHNCALIYTGCEDFDQALAFFLRVLEVPRCIHSPSATSAIQKACFLSLVTKGHLPSIPNKEGLSDRAFLEREMPCMLELEEAVQAEDEDGIQAVFDRHHRYLSSTEGNEKFQAILLSSLPKLRLLKLSKVYVSMPVTELRERVGVATEREAKLLLAEMVQRKHVEAFVESEVVFFRKPPSKQSSKQQALQDLAELSHSFTALREVKHRIECMQREVQESAFYVKKELSRQRVPEQSASSSSFF
jgi:hypothetical protein